jgi:hypothetical protein
MVGPGDETIPQSKPLLGQIVKQGRVVKPTLDLHHCRRYFQAEFARLPAANRALYIPARYTVEDQPQYAANSI